MFFFFPHRRLRALVESFSRKYLILAVTDNVVRPPDGFYAVITSAPPSVALWIIQDYVVIPLILIALRFQSKYGNSKGALRSNEVLSGRHDWAAAFISSFSLYLFCALHIVNNPATDICFSHNDLFHHGEGGKHIFTSSQCQRQTPALGASSLLPASESGTFSDEMFVSGGASCGSSFSSDVLPLLRTALISARFTSPPRHAAPAL